MCMFTFESLCNTLKVCRQHLGPGVWQLHHFSQLLWRSRMCLGLLISNSKHLELQGFVGWLEWLEGSDLNEIYVYLYLYISNSSF